MGTKKGREIDRIPLCANCMAEVDIDHLDENSVVQKGLRRLDQRDGGMNRRRWEARQLGKEKAKVTGQKTESGPHEKRGQDSQSRSACGDGADSEVSYDVGDEHMAYPVPAAEPSTIYVSMFDPIGRLAFRPSPTKPIPYWLEGIPAPLHGYLDEQSRTESKTSPKDPPPHPAEFAPVGVGGRHSLARPSGHGEGSSRPSYASTIMPAKSSKSHWDHINTRISGGSPTHSVSSSGGSASYKPSRPVPYKCRSYIVDEPLRLPSSLMPPLHHGLDSEDNLSTSTFSTYATPPEYPSPPGSVGGRRTSALSSEVHDSESHYIPTRPLEIRKSSHALVTNHARERDRGPFQQEAQREPRTRHSMVHIPTNNLTRSASTANPRPRSHDSLAPQSGGDSPSRPMSHRDSTSTPCSHNTGIRSSSPSHHGGPRRDIVVNQLRRNLRAEPTTALSSLAGPALPLMGPAVPIDAANTGDGTVLALEEGGQAQGGRCTSSRGNSQVSRSVSNATSVTSKKRSAHSELKRFFGR